MTWAATTLSTGLTLKKFEREIVKLAEEDTPFGSIAVSVSTREGVFQESEDYTNVNIGDILNVESTTDTTPVYVMTKDGSDTVTFGVGLSGIYAVASAFTIQSWQTKIDIAKDQIKARIENYLKNDGVTVDEDSGELLIDVIDNPEIFNYASDYYALFLIFNDLSGSTQNDIYEAKSIKYINMYKDEIDVQLKRLNFDYDLDGDVDDYRVELNVTGRITR